MPLTTLWTPILGCVCAATLIAGCAPKTELRIVGHGGVVRADDGYALTTYRLEQVGGEPRPKRATMIYVQGSGDESMQDHVGSLAGFAAMDLEVILAERRGVLASRAADAAVFRRFDTTPRRVADLHSVIDAHVHGEVGTGPVILVGEGEGGDVAAAVARTDPRITHLVLIGAGGGWTRARELEHLVTTRRGYRGIADVGQLRAQFDHIRAEPDSDADWLGHPHRYWNSYLWSAALEDLRTLDIPVFLAHGDADDLVPVESARSLAAELQSLGKSNFTYREYHDVNHAMRDYITTASIAPLLELDIIAWFRKIGLITEEEAAVFSERVRKAHPEWFGP